MRYIKKKIAIEGVKLAFSQTKADSVAVEDVAKAWGRKGYTFKQNTFWLGNKMTHWKYHNLVQPVYKLRNSRRVFDKLQLTLEGKRAIGRIEDDSSKKSAELSTNKYEVSLSEVMKLISLLKKENPDYEILFDVKLKNEHK